MTTLMLPATTTATQVLPADLVDCPDCATPARITRRAVLDSTDGPIEHVALHCERGHAFLMPSFLLSADQTR